MLEIESFLEFVVFVENSGNNGDSLIFPKFWGRGNFYFNGENWGIFGVGTVQLFWGIMRTNSSKNLK